MYYNDRHRDLLYRVTHWSDWCGCISTGRGYGGLSSIPSTKSSSISSSRSSTPLSTVKEFARLTVNELSNVLMNWLAKFTYLENLNSMIENISSSVNDLCSLFDDRGNLVQASSTVASFYGIPQVVGQKIEGGTKHCFPLIGTEHLKPPALNNQRNENVKPALNESDRQALRKQKYSQSAPGTYEPKTKRKPPSANSIPVQSGVVFKSKPIEKTITLKSVNILDTKEELNAFNKFNSGEMMEKADAWMMYDQSLEITSASGLPDELERLFKEAILDFFPQGLKACEVSVFYTSNNSATPIELSSLEHVKHQGIIEINKKKQVRWFFMKIDDNGNQEEEDDYDDNQNDNVYYDNNFYDDNGNNDVYDTDDNDNDDNNVKG